MLLATVAAAESVSPQKTAATAASPVQALAPTKAALGEALGSRTIEMPSSNDCRVKDPVFEGRSALRSVRVALKEKRPLRVIALGSSSTVGIGASSPIASYPVRLENDLEGVVSGLQVEMFARGQSGEVARGAAERIKNEVAKVRPDLVVWQVGTNDAVARIGKREFSQNLRSTLTWLASHKIDVVLIDPQYVERLASDRNYREIVASIAEIAREQSVLLVRRFDAMEDLAQQHPGQSYLAGDRFHLNDLGYRCMAEYAAKAILAGISQADREAALGTQKQ